VSPYSTLCRYLLEFLGRKTRKSLWVSLCDSAFPEMARHLLWDFSVLIKSWNPFFFLSNMNLAPRPDWLTRMKWKWCLVTSKVGLSRSGTWKTSCWKTATVLKLSPYQGLTTLKPSAMRNLSSPCEERSIRQSNDMPDVSVKVSQTSRLPTQPLVKTANCEPQQAACATEESPGEALIWFLTLKSVNG
jgi:hypothetical protein